MVELKARKEVLESFGAAIERASMLSWRPLC